MAYLADLEDKGELAVRTFTQPVFKTTSVTTEDFIGSATARGTIDAIEASHEASHIRKSSRST